MVSIVGFGRPKFGKVAEKTEVPAKSAKKAKVCPTCGK
jgi:hypothetical protein